MKRALLIGAALLVLAGCTPKATQIDFEVMPPELADCKTFELRNSSGKYITAMRCPNSITSTTYRSGKIVRTTVVIDGVTYVPQAAPGSEK